MPKHAERRHLPYPPEKLFDLVADVARYPEFLPWCLGARVYNKHATGLDADLIIGFRTFKERFTSRVKLDHPHHVHVDYIRGPLQHLHNDWRFLPSVDGGTDIDFHLDFSFKSPMFEKMVGKLFTEATTRMIGAFETRAHQLLGAKP